jgi:hypothetical protein
MLTLPSLVGRIPRERRASARRERATAEQARLPGITYMREASRALLRQVVPSYANPLDAADESGATPDVGLTHGSCDHPER